MHTFQFHLVYAGLRVSFIIVAEKKTTISYLGLKPLSASRQKEKTENVRRLMAEQGGLVKASVKSKIHMEPEYWIIIHTGLQRSIHRSFIKTKKEWLDWPAKRWHTWPQK